MPCVRSRNAYQHVSDFDKGRIVAYRDCGLSYRNIAARVLRDPAEYGIDGFRTGILEGKCENREFEKRRLAREFEERRLDREFEVSKQMREFELERLRAQLRNKERNRKKESFKIEEEKGIYVNRIGDCEREVGSIAGGESVRAVVMCAQRVINPDDIEVGSLELLPPDRSNYLRMVNTKKKEGFPPDPRTKPIPIPAIKYIRYRHLNQVTRAEIYLLLKMEGFVEKNNAASWLTVLDLRNWYFRRSLMMRYPNFLGDERRALDGDNLRRGLKIKRRTVKDRDGSRKRETMNSGGVGELESMM
ncbi:hypothetical protein TNCV_4963481 [Trichonephila clavipes]|nr:hypothetical protein TNCV_4963481 [Trichonephila clavipes]